jgi:ribonuclease R
MVHRLLQYYLDGGKSADQELYETKCLHSSTMEGLATSAEILSNTCRYMQDHQDQEFLGVISCNRMGNFVEIIENKCEGMVRIRDIKMIIILMKKNNALVGATSHQLLQLEMKLR